MACGCGKNKEVITSTMAQELAQTRQAEIDRRAAEELAKQADTR